VLLKTRHQKQAHQKQGYQKHLTRSYFTRVDKVQCTKCTTTNSAHASATTSSATCLHNKTRITVTLLQTLFRLKWNGFEISSSYDNYQIRQKINGEESKLQARQVDVTANFQRLSNPLYIGIKTWRTNTHIEHNKQKANTFCAKRRNHINNLENSYNSSYLRILKCLEKQSLFCSYCFVNTSDCISIIQNLIQLFVIVKRSLFQL